MQQHELFASLKPTPAAPRRTPREKGHQAAEACLAKAQEVAEFDPQGAGRFIVAHLRRHGETSGEDLVKAAKAHGFRGHDDRCFGGVFRRLVAKQEIRCVRSDLPRSRGHGTSGGRSYRAAP